jgi:DNA-binding MarR family transcriptional regulator
MDDFSRELNDLLVNTFWSILKVEEKMLKSGSSADLSISELHLIESVGKADAKGRTVSDIAADLEVAIPSVTVAINKLLRRGYLSKCRDENDGRVVYVTMTELGHKMNAAHSYFHKRMVRDISGTMTEEERAVLLVSLSKLNAFFRKKMGPEKKA